MTISDVRDYTLLTYCAMKDDLLGLKLIYEHAKSYREDEGNQANIIEWVNRETDRGYVALHYAAYNNNLEMVKYLVDTLGANIHFKNQWDQNVLHMAAMGDSVTTFVHFANLCSMDVN